MAVTLRQLSYFAALAQERSFQRAAAHVHISQPALSMQIRELEDTLGFMLVERSPRDLRLTPLGRAVLTRAQAILAQVRELGDMARWEDHTARLHLGVIPTVAPYLMPKVLSAFRQNRRVGDLRLREARTDTLVGELKEGMIDVAVLATPIRDDDLVSVPLFREAFVLAGSPERLALISKAEVLRPQSIPADELLLLEEGHCLSDQALAFCGLNRRQTRLDLGASSLSTLVALVAQGFGLTLLPEIALKRESVAGLDLRRFAAPEPGRDLVLVHRATTPAGAWIDDLADALCKAGQHLLA
jgi:LysR family transcriptional regulator, hydrogen peroxide-inducible genes activator